MKFIGQNIAGPSDIRSLTKLCWSVRGPTAAPHPTPGFGAAASVA